MRITVLGGGSWGTALAHLFARKGHELILHVRDSALAGLINSKHENPRYLPGLALCPSLRASVDEEEALRGTDILVIAVPCQFMREALREIAPRLPAHAVPVCASKGVELATIKRMSQVVADTLPDQAERYAILSGPSFAREVVEEKPTAVVLGCADARIGEKLREALSCSVFRVYSCTDVVGVELGGAVKNIMAIAAGFCDGLRLGDNARAALITRGLAEMSRLGAALGARPATFMGLSGMGDLVLTCTGDLSRNRQVGMRLAEGQSMERIAAGMHMVAEGVKTTEAVRELGQRLNVELPITCAVARLIKAEATPRELVHELMTRALREE
ncbi:NAD(P)-dependent glycerol-3-phosphate dehydrogenase [Desulfovibrio sp. OttesenSCG-928-A18]|nr:NAD(P)-dependent glycerol-3-phosphate dehydrogenase [Desulfovibrio sp. OttesenSCG-928-A18]